MQPNLTEASSFLYQNLAKRYPIYPFLGIVSTFFGIWVALLLIPQDFSPPGALVASALAMSIGLVIAPAIASLQNPQTFLRAEHLLAIAPIYWLLLDLLQGAYSIDATRHGVEGAFIAIGSFVVGVWIAALLPTRRLPKGLAQAASYSLQPKTLFRLTLFFFSLGIFRFAYPAGFNPITMIAALGESRWAVPWSRGALGGWDAFLDHMSYFGYLLPTLTVLLALRSRKLNLQLGISVLLSLIMAAFLASGGSRRILGVIVGAAIVCWLLEQTKLKLRHLVVLAISVVMLLFSMQYILEYRGVGFQKLFEENQQELHYKHLHVDDNFLRLAQIIDLVPAAHPYVYEKQIVYTLVRPIPRVFWAGKPTDPGFNLPETLGLQGVSLSSSVIGEWYLSLGWLGVFLGGWLYGCLASIASLLLVQDSKSVKSLVYSLAVMTLFAGMRSMQDLILMSYALLSWMLVSWVILRRKYLPNQIL